ncbi:MAG: NADH-quinone oxidoreductase subunit M [Chloroflexi bacterium HGW-Chloroflexi-5]|jgi:NADH-quinone oxidoreductase subunit M|nr:MAG: NADH-quinone oxidoreductase subunit M [Chloroflexi bacterium HGW-Chloroflexi-5]
MTFPFLSVLILLPLLAGVILLLLPAGKRGLIRGIALGVSLITFAIAGYLFAAYDKVLAGYQFVEQMQWLPALGISYHLGVDGFSLPLELLAGIVVLCGVMVSWKVEDRPREFFAFIMFLASSVFGVFASLDLFLLFFFFELAVFPKYLMIVMWGSPKTKEYGGMKLTLYLFFGSVVALVGVLAIYFTSGLQTFNLLELEQAGFGLAVQKLWFPFIFIGFGVLGGLFPFHSWAPDGHVAAPTAVSMLLAGVEMKVGAFAALRAGLMLLPDGMQFWAPLVLILATINVVYGAFIAMIQTDFKYVIGFSSVSHMGLVFIGFATLTPEGLTGAGLQMFSHGIMTALFFAVVGMVYDRAHTRNMAELGGLAKHMPLAMIGFVVGGLVSMGMPGFSGFVAEIPIYMGAWKTMPLVAIISVISIVVTAAYILLVVRRVFFGETPEPIRAGLSDISVMDKIVVVGLSLLMIFIGLIPSLLVPMIQGGVSHILLLVGGA